MQLRYKTLGIVAVTLAVTVLFIYVVSQAILINSYTDIEAGIIRGDVSSGFREIEYDQSTVDAIAVDYAYWNDTCGFLTDRDQQYIDSNFVDNTFSSQRLNAIILADSHDSLVYSEGFDLENQSRTDLPAGLLDNLGRSSQLFRSHADESMGGILMLPGGPMLISAYPVKNSDGTGLSQGTLIMGRFLNTAEIAKLQNITGIPMQLLPLDTPDTPALADAPGDAGIVVRAVDQKTVSGYALLKDVYGNPALVLRVDMPRTIYGQWQTSMLYIILILVTAGIAFSAIGVMLMDRFVISRMVRLSGKISEIGANNDFSARLPVTGDDELSTFAEKINETLDTLDHSQQKLHDSELRFRSLVEDISDMVWEMNADKLFTYVSPQSRDIMGYEPEDLLGKNPFRMMRKGEGERIIGIIAERIARGETPVVIEMEIPRPDGTMTYLEVSGTPIVSPAKQIVGYRGTARNISERKHAEDALRDSEERMRLCAAVARFGTFDWDIANDRHVWSPETYEIYGIPYGTSISSGILMGAIYPGDRQDAVLEAGLDPAGPGEYTMDYRIIRNSDREVRWVSVRARVIFIEEGPDRKAVRVLGAIQDITERKHAETQMLNSLREKEVLLKEIHHRVKNNLQIISSLLSLQSENISVDNPVKTFRESQDRIRSMALIHEKLYQARDISHVDFAEYVRSLTAYLSRSYVTSHGIKIIVDIEGISLGIDTAIPCGLIINELVSNSMKYAFPDGRMGEIRISLSHDGNVYRMIVTDNGIGLPPCFDFTKTRTLGLQLVNTLIGQLEGTIEVDSSTGTTIRIIFPDASRTPQND